MRILSTGDIHINLHRKKVPYSWQVNRFELLFNKLLELEAYVDVTVISGDIFDKKPEPDEVTLFLSYANRVTKPTIAIPGNHEATSKGETFLEYFTRDYSINNPNFKLFTKNDRIEIDGIGFQLFPYGEMQIGNIPKYAPGDILVTHIRGDVPPHIKAEFDFDKLLDWKLILLSDLHFNHRYKNYPAYYPGSPLNTTFDRDDTYKYGVDIIDFNSDTDFTVTFIDLDLPKLIRKTVDASTELVPDKKHHIVYEVIGTIDSLSKVKNHELLDKRIAEKPHESSKLDLTNKSIVEELDLYLQFIKVSDSKKIIDMFNSLGIKV